MSAELRAKELRAAAEQNCAAQNVEFADIARTIPCETGYVGTVDTKLEEGDKDG